MSNEFVFSCFVDNIEKNRTEVLRWAKSIINLGRISPEDIFVHFADSTDKSSDVVKWMLNNNINVVFCSIFPGHPYCNKLQQLNTFLHTTSKYIVLMDCDTVFTKKFEIDSSSNAPVYGKITDHSFPSVATLTRVFKAAGLRELKLVELTAGTYIKKEVVTDKAMSDHNNCNGGVYIIRKDIIPLLFDKWIKWATWCVKHIGLFDDKWQSADQVSFAMAMAELNLLVEHIGYEWNYGFGNFFDGKSRINIDPYIIHYYEHINNNGTLNLTGLPELDAAVIRYNNEIVRLTYEKQYNPN